MSLLDHYYIEDIYGVLYTVVGNRHPPGAYYAYIKYRPTSTRTPWSRHGVFYKRAFTTYSPRIVHSHYFTKLYDPHYDTEIPAVPRSIIRLIYDPRTRLADILRKPMDCLEDEVCYYARILAREANIQLSCMGITGSILPGIHNTLISDIDLIIYGVQNSVKAVEALNSLQHEYRPFTGDKLIRWCLRVSKYLNLEPTLVRKMYRSWRRGILSSGREYSITYSLDYNEPYPGERWITMGVARIKAIVEPATFTLNYPSRSVITKYYVITHTGSCIHPIREIISFESFYIPVLYEGGAFIIEGLLQYSPDAGYSRVLVGVKEHKGFIALKD